MCLQCFTPGQKEVSPYLVSPYLESSRCSRYLTDSMQDTLESLNQASEYISISIKDAMKTVESGRITTYRHVISKPMLLVC